MAKLPVSKAGYPVPWFVAWVDGDWDFRVIGPGKVADAHNGGRCWLCGERLGAYKAFTIGPMCTVNRISAEPPSHLDCAEYAVMACPFLSKPNMRRNENDMPAEGKNPAGIMIRRNPGVTALWVTKSYRLMRDGDGVLFRVGPPQHVHWYREGRQATRAEVLASIDSGLPLLEAAAVKDGAEAVAELANCYKQAQALLSAA